MAEIEITLPTVQYGNVKLRVSPEELGLESAADAAALGTVAAVYLNAFTQGFKRGSAIEVEIGSIVKAAGANESASQGGVDPEADEIAQAAQALAEGLGGATEVRESQSVADPGEADDAPWSKPAVDSKPKPWDVSGGSPAAEW